jgi:2',3'-cyclic-nucleotide 2'-phosphodiesterase (5'-nucleotidase family)
MTFRLSPFLSGIAVALALAAPASGEKPVHVVILHTNDIHGAISSQPATWIRKENPPPAGGLPALAAKIRKLEKEETAKGAKVLIVDCGDFYQGTPEGDMTDGKIVLDVMNEMGVDLLQVGNHDFDRGPKVVEMLSKRAKFPFLGANVRIEGTKKRPAWLRDLVDFPEMGIEVAGIISSKMKNLTTTSARAGLEFDDELETLSKLPWKKKRVRVVLSHSGLDFDRELVKSGLVDAVLGSHTHSRVTEVVRTPGPDEGGKGPSKLVPLLHSGNGGQNVGRLDLWIDRASGRLEQAKSEVILVPVTSDEGEDPAVKKIVDSYAPEIAKVMDVVVGELSEDLPRGERDGRSSPLGNYLTDLMREATGADIAIHNRTSIRKGLRKGPVRLRDLYEVSPFRNTVVVMNLTGRQVREMLETDLLSGRTRSEASGISVRYDLEKKELVGLAIGGAPIDERRVYKVATNSFLAKGGSGFKILTEGGDTVDTNIDLIDLHRTDLAKHPGGRPPDRTVRIGPVDTETPATAATSGS